MRYLAAYDGSEYVSDAHDVVHHGTGERHSFVEGEPRTLCDLEVEGLYVPDPEEEWSTKYGNCPVCADVLAPK